MNSSSPARMRRFASMTRRSSAQSTTTHSAGTLDLWTLAEHYGMTLSQKTDTEWCGSHPVHGSDTGTNVNINPTEQVWTCFRHTSGGGYWSLSRSVKASWTARRPSPEASEA